MVAGVVDEHRRYLADLPRVDAFRQAIRATVRPGDVVVDLGAGTGILGLLAAEAGAGRIYSIEASPLIGLTRQIAAASGWSDRFVFIRERSVAVDLPEPVDLVVSDQMDGLGFESGAFEHLADARERMLKPAGKTIPSRVSLWAAPVENGAKRAEVDFWSEPVHGFDMGAASEIALNACHLARFQASDLLSAPARLLSADPGARVAASWKLGTSMTAGRAGTLHGVGGWFSADLSPGVTMSSSPLDPARIDRSNVFLPIDRPVAVEADDRIDLRLQVRPYEKVVSWQVTVQGPHESRPRASFTNSTWKGLLLSAEDLRRTSPSYVPTLTPRGCARLTVLELCDGTIALDKVQDEVLRRHPALFRTASEAELFVAEVVARYAI